MQEPVHWTYSFADLNYVEHSDPSWIKGIKIRE